MDAKYLRIGNVVWDYFGGVQIPATITEPDDLNHSHRFNPMRLNNVVLDRLGCEWYEPLQHHRIVINDHYWFSITLKQKKVYSLKLCLLDWNEGITIPLKEVMFAHEVQNIIFYLTGEEVIYG